MNTYKIDKLREAVNIVYQAGLDLGDPMIMYNERYLEYFMAHILGHTKDENTQGADAYNEKGLPVEYKTINLDSKSGKGSWQWHWNKPSKFVKLKELDEIFCATRRGAEIVDIYEMPVSVAIDLAEDRILNESKTGVFDRSGFSFTPESLVKAGGQKITGHLKLGLRFS